MSSDDSESISTTNSFVQSLLTDLYQITMAYGYWRQGKHDETAVFELFFRKTPFHGEFVIFAGLGDCIEFVKKFRFSESDIDYLKTVLPENTDPAFFDYLSRLDCKEITLKALPEGTTAFPNVPLIVVEGPLAVCQLLETTLLNQVNFASLVCTNAARYRIAADKSGKKIQLIEFGLRRAQGADGAMTASKYTYVGGFDGTSNVLAGKLYGIPVKGTLAHSFITSFDAKEKLMERVQLLNSKDGEQKSVDFYELASKYANELAERIPGVVRTEISEGELRSFVVFASSFPNAFLALIDTYDVLKSGIITFCACALALNELGYKPIGVRIDSGDLAYLSKKVREILRSVAEWYKVGYFANLSIVASSDINEEIIYSLNDQNHEIDVFGVGTHLVTCQKQPALGCVYKLVYLRDTPRMKLSQDISKVTVPGRKIAFRFYGKDGLAINDFVMLDNEQPPQPGKDILCRHPNYENFRAYAKPTRIEPLHLTYWSDGEVKIAPRTVQEMKKEVTRSLASLREDVKRHLNPTPYKVSFSEPLYTFFHGLWLKNAPIGKLE